MKFSPVIFSNNESRGVLLKNIWFPYIILTITVFWLILITFLNEIPPDPGDGIVHFFISQASWENPTLLLDHWGKPIYSLLSSPFAQFGFQGIIFFQILTYVGTCLLGIKILRKLNCSPFLISLLPLLLILTNDYTNTILSALTEPLFNLFLVASLWFLLNKKWLLFAVFLSFTPYLRSEGQLSILLGVFILTINKQYKVIPLIFVGFLIYSSLGWFYFNDFWWYFTKSPYHLSNNIYGKGTWYHYLLSYKNYIGNHGLVLFILSMIIFMMEYKRYKKTELQLFLFSFSLFFGILTAHSYFWATGQNGSVGLTRITTQGLPLVFISCLFIVSKHNILHKKTQNSIHLIIILGCLFFLIKAENWPVKAVGLDSNIVNAARYLKRSTKKNQNIFYHHPLLAFKMETNPFKRNQQLKFHYGHDIKEQVDSIIKKGDLLVWDSHFSPVEGGLPFQELQNNKLTKVKQFVTNDETGIHIYQHQDTNIAHIIKHDTLVANLRIINKGKEFYDIFTIPQKEDNGVLEISIENFASACHIVCTDKLNKHYQAKTLKKGKNKFIFEIKEYTLYQIYIWSPEKKDMNIQLSEIVRISYSFPNITFYPNNTLAP